MFELPRNLELYLQAHFHLDGMSSWSFVLWISFFLLSEEDSVTELFIQEFLRDFLKESGLGLIFFLISSIKNTKSCCLSDIMQ